jgi:hypothetical protein
MLIPRRPADMTVPERLAEVAAILAIGYLRQRQIAAMPTPSTEKPLDVTGQPRPDGDGGSTRGEPVETEVA